MYLPTTSTPSLWLVQWTQETFTQRREDGNSRPTRARGLYQSQCRAVRNKHHKFMAVRHVPASRGCRDTDGLLTPWMCGHSGCHRPATRSSTTDLPFHPTAPTKMPQDPAVTHSRKAGDSPAFTYKPHRRDVILVSSFRAPEMTPQVTQTECGPR
jgi:hypothetical protein